MIFDGKSIISRNLLSLIEIHCVSQLPDLPIKPAEARCVDHSPLPVTGCAVYGDKQILVRVLGYDQYSFLGAMPLLEGSNFSDGSKKHACAAQA
jgi:hypothetical protein